MAKDRVWITRTPAGAGRAADAFARSGFETVCAPLLRIAPPRDMPLRPPLNAQMILTSQNGVKALAALTDRRHWRMITTGDATARLARDAGFLNVQSAQGDSADVIRLAKTAFNPHSGPVVHFGGQTVRGGIAEALRAEGFRVLQSIAYQSDPVTRLPEIDMNAISHVAIYSPKAAKTLARLSPATAHMTAISISLATDDALSGLIFKERRVAKTPDQAAMIAAIKA